MKGDLHQVGKRNIPLTPTNDTKYFFLLIFLLQSKRFRKGAGCKLLS